MKPQFKLLIIALSCYSVWASESSEEIEALFSNKAGIAFIKGAVEAAYNTNKYELINDMFNSLKDDIENITFVGTQNVYNSDGQIAEVRTVELHVPKKQGKDLIEFPSQEDDDDDVSVSEIKPMFELMSLLGFELAVLGEEYNSEGGIIEEAYMDSHLVYQYTDGIQLVNRTHQVDSYEDVKAKLATFEEKYDLVAVHEYDVNQQFVGESSKIVPELVAKINSDGGETNQALFADILAGLATNLLEQESNHSVVPAKLAEYLEAKYPEYNVYVFDNEPEAWYFSNKDFFKVVAQYDLASFLNDGEEVVYTVYGAKK